MHWSTLVIGTLLMTTLQTWAEDTKSNAAVQAVLAIRKDVKITNDDKECIVSGVLDYEKYREKLDVLREGFLDTDKTISFYGKRARQVLSFVISKYEAYALTIAVFESTEVQKPVKPCHFALDVEYNDQFGHTQTIKMLTWDFDRAVDTKIDWDKFEPRNFDKVALNYKFDEGLTNWFADEPQGDGDTPGQSARQQSNDCDPYLFDANALFVHATVLCRKDFMDDPAGLAALDGAKKCLATMDKRSAEKRMVATMKGFDVESKRRGLRAACGAMDDVVHKVMSGERP